MNYKLNIILLFFILTGMQCEDIPPTARFEDLVEFSAYDYIVEHEENFSYFLEIIKAGDLVHTLASYNPNGNNYTLFLPDNEAIESFVANSSIYSTINEMLEDASFVRQFGRFHVLNIGVSSANFPFGAFPEPTLSNDLLTVSINDSTYSINNQAVITRRDIEVSNGYIHILSSALTPVSITTYEWLILNEDYSIFKQAAELTGFDKLLDISVKDSDTTQALTLMVEADSVLKRFGISSLEELILAVSPDNENYTSPQNPLYNYVGYHILSGSYFLDHFESQRTNYATLSDIPLNVDGLGIEYKVNNGKEIFDTIVNQGDTTFIDYVGFLYDQSNVLTNTGVIHFIDKMLRQHKPSREIMTFQFLEEILFNQFRLVEGSFLIDEEITFSTITWSGADLFFVNLGNQETSAWGADYLEIEGDFEITYNVPRIVQGNYELYLGAEFFNRDNALIEIFVDGNKIGGYIDLTQGGTPNSPFQKEFIGNIVFTSYQPHVITIRSLIPGRFLWDYVRFEPI